MCCIIGMSVSLVIIFPGQAGTAAGQVNYPMIGPDEVNVDPAAPGPEDNVTIRILKLLPHGGHSVEHGTSVNGSLIEISIEYSEGGGVHLDMEVPWILDIPLGTLDHGEYFIEIESRYNSMYGPSFIDHHSGSFFIADQYVDPQGVHGHPRIQDALVNTSEGDIIRVFAGIYYEDFTISKTVSIVGNGTDATIVRSQEMTLNTSKITFSDISLVVNGNHDGGGEGEEAGDGNWGVEGLFQDVRHGGQLLVLISTLLLLFVLLGFVVRIGAP